MVEMMKGVNQMLTLVCNVTVVRCVFFMSTQKPPTPEVGGHVRGEEARGVVDGRDDERIEVVVYSQLT